MRRWYNALIIILTINILLIGFQYIFITVNLNFYEEEISETVMFIHKRNETIKELQGIRLQLDSIENKLDSILAMRRRVKIANKNPKRNQQLKNKAIEYTQTKPTSYLSLTSPKNTDTDSLDHEIKLDTNNFDSSSPIPTSNRNLSSNNNDGLFYGIAGFYSKNRKKEIVSKNDREFWIEIESRYSLLRGTIKKVTINGKEIEIKDVIEEEKESIGTKVKFTYLLSYFILVRVERNIIIEGNNKVIVFADMNYERELTVK